jgi:asparagine synthase (glutamine-hydrolysing)
LGGEQLDHLEKMLLDPRTMDRGYFRPDAVRNLFAEHRAGARDHGNRIWRLLNLEIWERVCLEGDPVEEVPQPQSAVLTR